MEFGQTLKYPVGIAHVIINGTAVVTDGVHTEALPGRILRRTAAGVT